VLKQNRQEQIEKRAGVHQGSSKSSSSIKEDLVERWIDGGEGEGTHQSSGTPITGTEGARALVMALVGMQAEKGAKGDAPEKHQARKRQSHSTTFKRSESRLVAEANWKGESNTPGGGAVEIKELKKVNKAIRITWEG